MRRDRAGAAVLGALGALLLAGLAGAEPAGAPLAAPGPCAEPRQPVQPGPVQPFDASRRELRGDPEFAVAGGPREHFDPKDVAAGKGDEGFEPPREPSFERGPCEAPDVGCPTVPEPRSGPVIVVGEDEPVPGDAPPFGSLQ